MPFGGLSAFGAAREAPADATLPAPVVPMVAAFGPDIPLIQTPGPPALTASLILPENECRVLPSIIFGQSAAMMRRSSGHRQVRTVLGDQARNTDATASGTPVARDLQDGSARRDLAEGDEARWHVSNPLL